MSLLWRRAAIASLVLVGCLALVASALAALTEAFPTAAGWFASGIILTAGTLLLYDGRRIDHVALFGVVAICTAVSLAASDLVLSTVLPAVPAGAAVLCAAIAWITRERQTAQTLADYYSAAVKARRIRENASQLEVVAALDTLRTAVLRYERRRRMPWAFLLRPPRGIYLYGAAGQGKSFLLDGMFDTLSSRAKYRFHFHELVADLSDAMQRNRDAAFDRAARSLVERASLVLIDELNVLDPATANMFMRLSRVWWRYGCIVCISSNQSPQQLFKGVAVAPEALSAFFDGLERHSQALKLDAGQDYRLQKLAASDLYQHPIDEGTPKRLRDIVDILAEAAPDREPIEVGGRQLAAVLHAPGVAWFDFANLCDAPLSYRDYLALVDRFPNLVISNVPYLEREDPARRFAWLVEIFYDRRKRLILSAEAPVRALFAPGLSSRGSDIDFIKIQSRLVEMQSSEYEYSLV